MKMQNPVLSPEEKKKKFLQGTVIVFYFLFCIFYFFPANVRSLIRIGTRLCLCVLLIIDIF